MKIISYLLNKLNGFRIGIDEDGNAQLISYRNHPFTNTGGGAKKVEAFVVSEENSVILSQSKYDELDAGDVLISTMLNPQVGNLTVKLVVVTTVPSGANTFKFIYTGGKFLPLASAVPYPVEGLIHNSGELYDEVEFVIDNDKYSAISHSAITESFTAAYDIIFALDTTLVKLERCNSSYEPTEVVSGATLAIKTEESADRSITYPCLSFSDNLTTDKDIYYYKATTSDGEINFSISYQGMA